MPHLQFTTNNYILNCDKSTNCPNVVENLVIQYIDNTLDTPISLPNVVEYVMKNLTIDYDNIKYASRSLYK